MSWRDVEDLDPYVIANLEQPLLVLEQNRVAALSVGLRQLLGLEEVLEWVDLPLEELGPHAISAALANLLRACNEEEEAAQLARAGKRLFLLQGWQLRRRGGPRTTICALSDLSSKAEANAQLVRSSVLQMAGESEATNMRLHGLRMIGNTPSMRQAWKRLRQVAGLEIPVLLSGETGTGKSAAAKAIHPLSARRDGPFESLNCASIPANLAESQLFGHVQGAFTGATQDRKGVFELADGGTIFLDEIAELDNQTQAKLLEVLESAHVRPVGAERDRPVNCRLITATHRDLRREVAEGRFREDLYYRIRVFELEFPPLRDREEDVTLLAHFFAQELARELGRPVPRFAEAVRTRMTEYEWPGNLRQLRNAIQFALVTAEEEVQLNDLPPEVRSAAKPERPKLDKERIEEALKQAKGKRVEAARLLGVSRVTLWKWIKKLDISVEL